jgi:hypothetical protein
MVGRGMVAPITLTIVAEDGRSATGKIEVVAAKATMQ